MRKWVTAASPPRRWSKQRCAALRRKSPRPSRLNEPRRWTYAPGSRPSTALATRYTSVRLWGARSVGMLPVAASSTAASTPSGIDPLPKTRAEPRRRITSSTESAGVGAGIDLMVSSYPSSSAPEAFTDQVRARRGRAAPHRQEAQREFPGSIESEGRLHLVVHEPQHHLCQQSGRGGKRQEVR